VEPAQPDPRMITSRTMWFLRIDSMGNESRVRENPFYRQITM